MSWSKCTSALVHLFSISGLLLGFAALEAIMRQEFYLAAWCLLLTIVIDGLDGPLARWAEVKTHLPNIDGAMLDNIIDFTTWVFIPCFFLGQLEIIPKWLCYTILVIAPWQLSCRDIKSSAHVFKRFPSAWSLVALFLFLNGLTGMTALAIVVIACFGSVVGLYFPHPLQTNPQFGQRILYALRLGTLMLLLLFVFQLLVYPNISSFAAIVQLILLLAYLILVLWFTLCRVKK